MICTNQHLQVCRRSDRNCMKNLRCCIDSNRNRCRMIDRRRRSSSHGYNRRSLQPTGNSIGCIRCCKSFLIALSTCLFIGVKVGRYDTCYRCATNKQHKRFKVTAANEFLCTLRAQVTNQLNKRLPDGAAVVVATFVLAAYTSA